jgi:Ca2+-binding EF-hand superfamily protein
LRQIFDQWDLNRNGQIDARELSEALRQMGESNDPETVREMIRSYDVDGNGAIDFYGNTLILVTLLMTFLEFSDLFKYIQSLKSSFNSIAQSDRIGFNDAKNIFTSMHGSSLAAAPVPFHSLWKSYDRTGQGKVSFRDFKLMAFSLKSIMKNYYKTKIGRNSSHNSQNRGGFLSKFL